MSTKYTMTIGTLMCDVCGPHDATGYTGYTPKSGIEKDKLTLEVTLQLFFTEPKSDRQAADRTSSSKG